MSEPTNGHNASTRVTVIQVLYNHETCSVSLGINDVPIALAQMMLDEAARTLDLMRRHAAAMELRQQMVDQALMNKITGRGPAKG